MEIDTLRGNPARRHHPVDACSRRGRDQPGTSTDAARSRATDDQRSAALGAPARPGRDLHRCLLGPAGRRAVMAITTQEFEPIPDQRGPNGRRHGDAAGVASRPASVGRHSSPGSPSAPIFAAYAAVRRPELVAALVSAFMDIDIPAAENNAYAFALGAARRRGNRRAIGQLEAIGPPPHTNVKQFVMAQGRLRPGWHRGKLTQQFHDALTAPSKQLVWFEKSAHTPTPGGTCQVRGTCS